MDESYCYEFIAKSTELPHTKYINWYYLTVIIDNAKEQCKYNFLQKHPKCSKESITVEYTPISKETYLKHKFEEENNLGYSSYGHYYTTTSFNNIFDLLSHINPPYEIYKVQNDLYLHLPHDNPLVEEFLLNKVPSNEATYYYLLEYGKKLSLSKEA